VITVITPTWERHDLLLNRCIPSVAAQQVPGHDVEHIVVSDGPDPALRRKVAGQAPHVIYAELGHHQPGIRWGVRARQHGEDLAKGDLIGWLDDDNAYRPGHLAHLAAALDANPAAGFAYSIAQFHAPGGDYLIGSPQPVYGGIDTSIIMNRASLRHVADWRDDGQQTIDWDIVERWLQAGQDYVFVSEISVDYYFS
jgi:glycosyltransferase involved in cell wall biosynthesis